MKNKIIDTAFNVAIAIFVLGVSFGFYKQVEANRNLNHKIEILQKHNKKISEEVDKLHKTVKSIDAEIAKRLKDTAERNKVGG
mgnify:CR=1 FL=1|jgi:chaperonin cofactor prefoldin